MENVAITSIPIPHVCEAVLTGYNAESCNWDVLIINSPLGPFDGPVQATLLYNGDDPQNFKVGDNVKVLAYFIFNPTTGAYDGTTRHTEIVVLGKYETPHISGAPLEDSKGDEKRWIHKKSRSGLAVSKHGRVSLRAPGVNTVLSPAGKGVYKNSRSDSAQNFHRVISNNAPDYSVREHFGQYEGADSEEESTNTSPEDHSFIYRRYVSKDKAMGDWVSTCEGTHAPFVGPNNQSHQMGSDKEVLYTKIVNAGNKRVTILIGDKGDNFVGLRVDDVVESEKSVAETGDVTPGVVENLFSLSVSDSGEVTVSGGSTKRREFKIKAGAGGVSVNSAGRITLTHGDSDESINSIVMDPDNGIDITAENGFRINGKTLVTESFIDWLDKFKASICQSAAPGSPAPISPAAQPELTVGAVSIMKAGGFTTKNSGVAASKKIQDNDQFFTI